MLESPHSFFLSFDVVADQSGATLNNLTESSIKLKSGQQAVAAVEESDVVPSLNLMYI